MTKTIPQRKIKAFSALCRELLQSTHCTIHVCSYFLVQEKTQYLVDAFYDDCVKAFKDDMRRRHYL